MQQLVKYLITTMTTKAKIACLFFNTIWWNTTETIYSTDEQYATYPRLYIGNFSSIGKADSWLCSLECRFLHIRVMKPLLHQLTLWPRCGYCKQGLHTDWKPKLDWRQLTFVVWGNCRDLLLGAWCQNAYANQVQKEEEFLYLWLCKIGRASCRVRV